MSVATPTAQADSVSTQTAPKPETKGKLIVQQPSLDSKSSLEAACNSYDSYLKFPSLHDDETKAVAETVESMLARLDEMGTVIDSISSEHDKMRKEVLPLLQSRAAHLKRIFATIDKYQELIDATKKSVTDMEARVEASQEATATISVQKIFSFFSEGRPYRPKGIVFLLQKKPEEPDARLHKNVNIVNTTEWFEQARKDLKSSASTSASS